MTVVVDTNILFSACLTPQGRVFELLILSRSEFISAHLALTELTRHKQKLIRLSKLPVKDLETIVGIVIKQVDFVDEAMIEEDNWRRADALTKDVDRDDIAFVALALQTGGILWTGDKKLSAHLKTLGFHKIVDTIELSRLLNLE